jgi:hypothetical protein
MKKLLIFSASIFLFYGSIAQNTKFKLYATKPMQLKETTPVRHDISNENNHELTTKSKEIKEMPLLPYSKPKQHKDTYSPLGWTSSVQYAIPMVGQQGVTWAGALTQLFPDSLAGTYYQYVDEPDYNRMEKGMPAIGYIFDPYSESFGENETRLLVDEYGDFYNYRIDDLDVAGEYRIANYNPLSPDTLRVYLSYFDVHSPQLQFNNEYDANVYTIGGVSGNILSPKIQYTSISVPQKGSIVKPKAANSMVFDYILSPQDSVNPGLGMVEGKYMTIPVNYEVPAGSVLGVIIKFVPGYTYNNNDTLVKEVINLGSETFINQQKIKNKFSAVVIQNTSHFGYFMDFGGGYNGRLMEDFDVRYKKNNPQTYNFTYYPIPIIDMNISMGTQYIDYYPILTTAAPTSITSNSVYFSASMTQSVVDSIVERGFMLREQQQGGNFARYATSQYSGNDFFKTQTNLTPNTIYDFLSYVIVYDKYEDESYIIYYSSTVQSFKTLAPQGMQAVTKPTTNIQKTSATLNGALTLNDDSPSDFGFFWREYGTSTWQKEDSYYMAGGSTGFYCALWEGELTPNTKYEVVAYGVSSLTNQTYRGDTLIFQTLSASPQVMTLDATDLTETSAVLNGNIIEDSDEPVLLKGFEWKKQGDATFNKASSETLSPSRASISSLQQKTMYEFKAFATTAKATYYGDLKTFETFGEVSIADISSTDKIKIYPNPANNIIYIESDLSIEQIDIYDISGRKLKQFSTITNNQLSIEDLSSGIYLIKIAADKKEFISKIIKE